MEQDDAKPGKYINTSLQLNWLEHHADTVKVTGSSPVMDTFIQSSDPEREVTGIGHRVIAGSTPVYSTNFYGPVA